MLNANLLATKLHRPSLPAKSIQRPHLIRRLDEGLELNRQVTLVSAPPGFGKTTCISAWLDTIGDRPDAWLSLDPSDDDPVRFFVYFIAALQKVDAGLGGEIENALHSGRLPPAEIISTSLVHSILQLGERFLLVLDDFQVIQDGFILQVLEELIANLPDLLHLVLITREDPALPLARLRANNRLTEIRARDLRLTGADTGRFLQEVMNLSLSQADIALLEDKTEGWIAGLQLAGLSIRDRDNPSSFIAGLSGIHRHILGYLTEQVMSKQPEEIRQFLLQTAILDQLTGELCNAVTGRSDGSYLLEHLYNANLFLIPLDDEGQWYRYHHLFADLLQDMGSKLHDSDTVESHRRASRWYADSGMASKAVQHALAAKDYPAAVELLEVHAMGMIMQGYAKTVNGWLQEVPVEWRLHSPRTNLAFAWMHLLRGAYADASPYLKQLEGTLSSSQLGEEDRRSLKAEWLVMQSLLMNMERKLQESLALAEQALETAHRQDHRVMSLVYFGLACAHQAVDHYEVAVDAYQKSIQHGRTVENQITEMMSTSGLAQLAFEHGQLHLAFEIAAPVSERLDRSGSPPPISTVVFGILGEVYYQWNQIEQARRYGLQALQLSTLGGYSSGVIGCRLFLSRLSQLEGDMESAAREIQAAVDLTLVKTPDYIRQEVAAQQVRVSLARHLPGAAQIVLQSLGFSFQSRFSFPKLDAEDSLTYSMGLLYNSVLRLLLYRAREDADPNGLGPGIELADILADQALKRRFMLTALETLLLRAQMHTVFGNHSASRADYLKALELAEPEGFIAVLVEQGLPVAEALEKLIEQDRLENNLIEYVQRILSVFSEPFNAGQDVFRLSPSSGQAGLIEPLTDRELDVLHLMAEGLKYREIAERLFITLNTVRSHTKAIFGKLQVSSRAKAVEKARRLQIP